MFGTSSNLERFRHALTLLIPGLLGAPQYRGCGGGGGGGGLIRPPPT